MRNALSSRHVACGWHFTSDGRGGFWRGLLKASPRPRHGTGRTQRRGYGMHPINNTHTIISVIPHGELSREATKGNREVPATRLTLASLGRTRASFRPSRTHVVEASGGVSGDWALEGTARLCSPFSCKVAGHLPVTILLHSSFGLKGIQLGTWAQRQSALGHPVTPGLCVGRPFNISGRLNH